MRAETHATCAATKVLAARNKATEAWARAAKHLLCALLGVVS